MQQPIADLLEGAMERGSLLPLWDRNAPPPLTQTIQREGMDVRQNSLLMLAQPFTVAGETGWLVSLVDISALRQAMAQRDQAMTLYLARHPRPYQRHPDGHRDGAALWRAPQ